MLVQFEIWLRLLFHFVSLEKSTTFAPLAGHVRKIANVHVRAVGTVAGNLCLARSRGFWRCVSVCQFLDRTFYQRFGYVMLDQQRCC